MNGLFSFGLRPDFPTVVTVTLGLIVAVAAAYLYFRARLRPDMRGGLSPHQVRLSAFALGFAIFGFFLCASRGAGLGLAALFLIGAWGIALFARARSMLLSLLAIAVVLGLAAYFVSHVLPR